MVPTTLAVSFLLTFIVLRRITRPLTQLIESTEAVSLGRMHMPRDEFLRAADPERAGR